MEDLGANHVNDGRNPEVRSVPTFVTDPPDQRVVRRPMRPLIGTSWKMHLTASQAVQYLQTLRPLVADLTDRDLFVLPAYPAIPIAREQLDGSNIAWGAQDVHPEDWGAHTGDVSAPMLADLGCRYVEVGHSERRREHGETTDVVARKIAAVARWRMTPILSIGDQHRHGPQAALAELMPSLERLLAGLPRESLGDLVIAYEPAWAIGEGAAPASPEEVGAVLRELRASPLLKGVEASGVRLIYGGSVDQSIAEEMLSQPCVDGLFIGRQGLDPYTFAALARTACCMSHSEP